MKWFYHSPGLTKRQRKKTVRKVYRAAKYHLVGADLTWRQRDWFEREIMRWKRGESSVTQPIRRWSGLDRED